MRVRSSAVTRGANGSSRFSWQCAAALLHRTAPPTTNRSDWLARMAERYRWVRVVLHLRDHCRSHNNVRWHLSHLARNP